MSAAPWVRKSRWHPARLCDAVGGLLEPWPGPGESVAGGQEEPGKDLTNRLGDASLAGDEGRGRGLAPGCLQL